MTDVICQRLKLLVNEYYALDNDLSTDEVINNPPKLRDINIRMNSIHDIIKAYENYEKYINNLNETKNLLNENDEEIVHLAKEEIKTLTVEIEKIEQEIYALLLPKSADDRRNVIIEIRGAAGGDEGNIFAGNLFEMYTRFAEMHNWKIEVTAISPSEAGGFSQICFIVKGKDAYKTFKYESGVHRVQRIPATENKGRTHTSTTSVAVLPEVNDIEVKINLQDLRIDTYRASGAGGQHVNMTDSAVRITHIPTGLVVTSQDGRSQHDNKDKAMKVLRAKLYEKKLEEEQNKIRTIRKLAVGTGMRAEKIRTYNYPQNRVTDHRIGLTINRLDQIMAGDLDEIITTLMAYDQKEQLEELVI